MKTLYKFIIPLLVLAGCTREIDSPTAFEPQLFILGTIGNEPDNITIRIQETVPVNQVAINPLNNAVISLYSKSPSGNKTLVTNNFEASNGVYVSKEIVSPTIGNYYWIEVEIPGRATFKSLEEQMKPVVPISSITKKGTALEINFEDPGNDNNSYYVKLDYYNDNEFLYSIYELATDVIFNGNENASIETFGISGNRVNATMFNLNYKSFLFYSNLNVQEYENISDDGVADPGRLFSTPPVNLTGNITNVSTNRPALGNFGVASFDTYEFKF